MEWVIFSQGLRENFRLKRFLPWVVLGFLCMMLTIYWHSLQADASVADRYGKSSTILVFHILALTAAIMTSSIMTQEIEQKTIVYLVTRPVPRWKLAVFRYLACSIAVTATAIINVLFVSAGSYGATSNPYLLNDIAALAVGAFAYCALFMFIGMLFNRAMIICLLFAFGWETAVPNMPGSMCYLSINSYIQAIAQHSSASPSTQPGGFLASAVGVNSITPTMAYIGMIGMAVVLTAASGWWFSTNEYLPREDAE